MPAKEPDISIIINSSKNIYSQKVSTRALKSRYILALALIAILATAVFIGMYLVIKTTESSAALINVSGRQRMLSQRIGLFAHDLLHEKDESVRNQCRKDLLLTADIMEKSHKALLDGDEKLNLPGKSSPEIRAIYYENPLNLDRKVTTYIAAARKLASSPPEELTHTNPSMQTIEDNARFALLQSLDTVVAQYQKESEEKIEWLIIMALSALGLLLATLVVEGKIIFAPLVRRIESEAGALELSEQKLRDITSTLGEGVIVSDKEGRLSFMNPEAERLTGWTEAEVVGKPIYKTFEVFNKEGEPIRAEDRSVMKTITRGETVREHECLLKRKDQKMMPMALVTTPIKKGGEIIGAVAAFHDIMERKLAEQALKNKAEQVRLLQEIAIAANEAATVDEAILICLDKVCAYTGWEVGHAYIPDSSGILISSGLWRMNDPEEFEDFRKITAETTFKPGEGLPGRVYESGKPAWISDLEKDENFPRIKMLKEIKVKAGFAFPVLEGKKVVTVLEFFAKTTKQPDYSLLATIGYLATQLGRVTERKRAEEALRTLGKAIKETGEMIVITDENGIIQYINSSVERIMGYRPDEVIGTTPRVLKAGEGSSDVWETIRSGAVWHGEIVNRKKSGQLYDEELTISPVRNEQGRITNYVAIKRDITRRKQSEKELRQARDEAEKSTKLKDDFVSLVAHDLRAPFNSILGMLRLLQSDKSQPMSDRQSVVIKRVLANGENMVNMIDKLLDISRLQAGKIIPRKTRVDAHVVVAASVASLNYIASEKGIRLINNVPFGSEVIADADMLGEVVKNLVSNAIKFCNKDDTITIFIPTGKPATIAVKDTGPGIADDLLDNLFRHDIKTSTIGTDGEFGTGLGLPLSRDIMKAHGGDLIVETGPDKGSVFFAELPDVSDRALQP